MPSNQRLDIAASNYFLAYLFFLSRRFGVLLFFLLVVIQAVPLLFCAITALRFVSVCVVRRTFAAVPCVRPRPHRARPLCDGRVQRGARSAEAALRVAEDGTQQLAEGRGRHSTGETSDP